MRRRVAAPVEVSDGVPVGFADAAHPLWTGPVEVYVEYMQERGWSLPARERAGIGAVDVDGRLRSTGAAGRRRQAVAQWAVQAGITSPSHPHTADFHQLDAMGLL